MITQLEAKKTFNIIQQRIVVTENSLENEHSKSYLKVIKACCEVRFYLFQFLKKTLASSQNWRASCLWKLKYMCVLLLLYDLGILTHRYTGYIYDVGIFSISLTSVYFLISPET